MNKLFFPLHLHPKILSQKLSIVETMHLHRNSSQNSKKKDKEIEEIKKELEFLKNKMASGKFVDIETINYNREMSLGMESIMKICKNVGK
jgi:hypothetical protein